MELLLQMELLVLQIQKLLLLPGSDFTICWKRRVMQAKQMATLKSVTECKYDLFYLFYLIR